MVLSEEVGSGGKVIFTGEWLYKWDNKEVRMVGGQIYTLSYVVKSVTMDQSGPKFCLQRHSPPKHKN